MHVRPATPEDARGIAEVHVRAWQEGYRGLLPDAVLDALAVDDRERTWHAHLTDADNDVRTLVAEDDAGIVGFVSLTGASRDPDAPAGVAEIPALYVEPARWRSGIGRGLMATALAALRAADAAEVTLWVLQLNVRGRQFYASLGFEPDGSTQANRLGPLEVRLRKLLGAGPHQAAS